MKTLIFFGSPRKQGDTRALLDRVLATLEGEYLVVDAYRDDIRPCVDCRACREKRGCIIKDGMQKIYDYMRTCDNVLIAAPLYFSELPGQLLNVFSRLQCVYSAQRFLREKADICAKKGGIILVGGGDGGPDKALDTCGGIFCHYMNVKEQFLPIMSLKTDQQPANQDAQALEACDRLAAFFNGEKEDM